MELEYILLLPIVAFLFGCFVLASIIHWKNRRIKRLRKLLERERQKIEAYEALGYDPIECIEVHLPGDCPLCGAK